MAEKKRRSIKHSLISGVIVLAILFGSRGYWSGQGFGYLVIAAIAASIMAEYATARILHFLDRRDRKNDQPDEK